MKEKEFFFEEINEETLNLNYTAECSGGVSDCCTRVCTRVEINASIEEWGKFLEVGSGVIQY